MADRRTSYQLDAALTENQIDSLDETQFRREIFKQLVSLNRKVDPMFTVFTSFNGFSQISVLIFKICVGIGTVIGLIYTVSHFIVKNGSQQ